MVFTRTLNFTSKDLGKDLTLLLTFDDPASIGPGLYVDKFPICWKVVGMPGKGPGNFSVTYKNQLAFTKPQVDNDKLISAGTFVDIDLGQKTELKSTSAGPPPIYEFTTPVAGAAGNITATNVTEEKQSIGVGFHVSGNKADTGLLWQDVGKNSNVVAQFTPVLRGYATANYQQNQILRGAIQTGIIFNENLANLAEITDWVVAVNSTNGEITITKA